MQKYVSDQIESKKFGIAAVVQGTIVQEDGCPRNLCPMTQMLKETIVQQKFCSRKLLPWKSLLKMIVSTWC